MLIELDQNDFLYDLTQNDEVLVYEEEDSNYKRFCSCLSENIVKVCVKDLFSLKNRIMNDLNVNVLPFCLYFGHLITNRQKIRKLIYQIDEIKYDLLERKINKMLYLNKIAVFILGTPDTTDDYKSRELFNILNEIGYEKKTLCYYNILLNERLKNYVMDYSKHKTFPQLYIDGKFIGGIEKIRDLYSKGILKKLLNK